MDGSAAASDGVSMAGWLVVVSVENGLPAWAQFRTGSPFFSSEFAIYYRELNVVAVKNGWRLSVQLMVKEGWIDATSDRTMA